jgi:predicted DCC family thiol-disulfide oxidoreductase YuxK
MSPDRVVLYDGHCGLCDRTVQWLLRKDRAGALRFAPLQGETARALRDAGLGITDDLDTVVFVDDGKLFVRSRAFTQVARYLPAPWRWGAALRVVPAFVLDLAYRLVARTRYRLFGRLDSCRVPSPEERVRFLP